MKNIFEGTDKKLQYAVVYDQLVRDSGWRIGTRYGSPSIDRYDNGIVAYQQMDFFTTRSEANRRSVELLKITNKKYVRPRIVDREEYYKLNGYEDHE